MADDVEAGPGRGAAGRSPQAWERAGEARAAQGCARGDRALGAQAATRRGASIVVAATLALAAAGCAAPVPLDAPAVSELPAPVPDWIAIRITEADHLGRVQVPRGASFAVALRAQTAAGVGWVDRRVPRTVVRTGRFSGPVWPPGAPASAAVPPPLWQVFVYEAREPGEDDLEMVLAGDGAGGRPRRLQVRIGVVAP